MHRALTKRPVERQHLGTHRAARDKAVVAECDHIATHQAARDKAVRLIQALEPREKKKQEAAKVHKQEEAWKKKVAAWKRKTTAQVAVAATMVPTKRPSVADCLNPPPPPQPPPPPPPPKFVINGPKPPKPRKRMEEVLESHPASARPAPRTGSWALNPIDSTAGLRGGALIAATGEARVPRVDERGNAPHDCGVSMSAAWPIDESDIMGPPASPGAAAGLESAAGGTSSIAMESHPRRSRPAPRVGALLTDRTVDGGLGGLHDTTWPAPWFTGCAPSWEWDLRLREGTHRTLAAATSKYGSPRPLGGNRR